MYRNNKAIATPGKIIPTKGTRIEGKYEAVILLNLLYNKVKFLEEEKFMTSSQNIKTIPENLEAMRKFSETYAKRTNTFFCIDQSVTAIVIEGLARHKDEYGAPLCPCRHYENKEAEVDSAYWNCPCVPMRERKECHCMLFLTKDNEFASTNQQVFM
jgi:ferredoxin-thioredoxin reductase catalytic chain